MSLLLSILTPFLNFFFGVDSAYVQRDEYHFQALLKNSYSYEMYQIRNEEGELQTFRPESSLKVGPSIGYSVFFVGLYLDLLHLDEKNKRTEWDMSFYTMPMVFDLYYRDSGESYQDGFNTKVTGVDVYYVFNHKKFSYPAAFSRTTQQKRSAGSAIAGIGYTRHSISMSLEGLPDNLTYTDFSLSGGYAYNFVLAKNWWTTLSLSAAVSRKQTVSETATALDALEETFTNFTDFNLRDLTLNATGRFALVYNNGRWFAGGNAIIHNYNYRNEQFYTNNAFGSINLYLGINF